MLFDVGLILEIQLKVFGVLPRILSPRPATLYPEPITSLPRLLRLPHRALVLDHYSGSALTVVRFIRRVFL